jgi:hypothetical protein
MLEQALGQTAHGGLMRPGDQPLKASAACGAYPLATGGVVPAAAVMMSQRWR